MIDETPYICTNPNCYAFKTITFLRQGLKAGWFIHPHLGKQQGLVCPYCYYLVAVADNRIPA